MSPEFSIFVIVERRGPISKCTSRVFVTYFTSRVGRRFPRAVPRAFFEDDRRDFIFNVSCRDVFAERNRLSTRWHAVINEILSAWVFAWSGLPNVCAPIRASFAARSRSILTGSQIVPDGFQQMSRTFRNAGKI